MLNSNYETHALRYSLKAGEWQIKM